MENIGQISVEEAASILGVDASRVRAMLSSGHLDGYKHGGVWIIDASSVFSRKAAPRKHGRQFSPRNAWYLIAASSRDEKYRERGSISSKVRWKLDKVLESNSLASLKDRLHDRASVGRFEAHPGVLQHILKDPRLVLSGASASKASGFEILSGAEADGYVKKEDLDALINQYALVDAGSRAANVLLRLINDRDWPFGDDAKYAMPAAVALDLSEYPDGRTSSVGQGIVDRWES